MREAADACRAAGLRLGVYLSPGDLHEPAYGRDSAAYNEYFRNQLRELLTDYGEISEVWLDGAQPSRLKQDYDFPSYYRLVRELQPDAVIVSKGPDVRWVGNESGIARESEWSVIPLPTSVEEYDWPDLMAPDLGSWERLKGAKALHWYPAVCNTSLERFHKSCSEHQFYEAGAKRGFQDWYRYMIYGNALGPDWFWDRAWEPKLRSLGQLKRLCEAECRSKACDDEAQAGQRPAICQPRATPWVARSDSGQP